MVINEAPSPRVVTRSQMNSAPDFLRSQMHSPSCLSAMSSNLKYVRPPLDAGPYCQQHRIKMVQIKPVDLSQDLGLVRQLFREYAASLEIDLCFQNFEEELASLPGKYQSPQGRLLLARDEQMVLGCVALRPIDTESCEMKRLYVRPQARGLNLGQRLAERICDEAKQAGYQRICLDTLPSMTPAIRIYEGLGFKPIGAYVFNPVKGAIFLGLELKGLAVRPDRAS